MAPLQLDSAKRYALFVNCTTSSSPMLRNPPQGPLVGLKVLEFAGMGPGPFCGMLLSDMGADVVRIDRGPSDFANSPWDVTARGRRSILLDLKSPCGVEVALRLADEADALIEGFRPGVMERLGLGPEILLSRNAKLIYGRMTGWGQHGPYAMMAGHDLNYIAISGVLSAIGTEEKPLPPLNLIGDYGGGGTYLAFGLLAGIIQARVSGRGQVIDCAMCDGALSLASMIFGMRAGGMWIDRRQSNVMDGAAPYYDTYCCCDGQWISVACGEPHFYAILLDKLGLTDDPDLPEQNDREGWPRLRAAFAKAFATRTREQWSAVLVGTDACFAPVWDFQEAPHDAHVKARGALVEIGGIVQPAPAPRFSATPGAIQGPPPEIGADCTEVLRDWGFSEAEIVRLIEAGGIRT